MRECGRWRPAGLVSAGWAFAGGREGEVVGPILTHACASVFRQRGSALPVEVSSGGRAGQSIDGAENSKDLCTGRGHLPGQPTSLGEGLRGGPAWELRELKSSPRTV